jgi:hypothetical protein
MRARDLGAHYRVHCSAEDVAAFMRSFPCSGLSGHPIAFDFAKRNGDLVDVYPNRPSEDGPGLVALSHDAQAYGRKRLRLDAPKFSPFTAGYLECALCASELDAYSIDNIDQQSFGRMLTEAEAFSVANRSLLNQANAAGRSDDHLGHDFWLTRNRHGAGFWDRGLGQVGDDLTERAHAAGERHLYVGGDGRVYQSP